MVPILQASPPPSPPADLSVIDRFMETFSVYIDSGFGLLGPEVDFLVATLIVIDLVLAGVFWAMSSDGTVMAKFIKKVLYIGAFAYIIGNFAFLSGVIFDSFTGLGLQATGTSLTAADLMRPGFIASTGFDAATPILDTIKELTGPVAFFVNIVLIAVLFLAWLITIFAFFFLAIQLFVTIIEFKLTTLAGFVLVPFALWNKTSFLAERVLGNVVSSGIKVMVLAVIIGIGSTLFSEVTSGLSGSVTLEDAGGVILASLALFALGLFGPGIATGLVSGAPQLGAGAVVGTAAAVGAAGAAGVAGTIGATKVAGGTAVGAAKAGASLGGGTSMAFAMGKAASGAGGMRGTAAGLGAVAQAGVGSVAHAAKRRMYGAGDAIQGSTRAGARGAVTGTGGTIRSADAANSNTPAADVGGPNPAPDWARKASSSQNRQRAESAALHGLRGGDSGGASTGPKLNDED
ncbi:MAG: P-type conjugative transfer protein TrbL [Litorimonas sp.]|uniref:Conjugal transfer protein TrbL n=1 Tax=Algimonas ampicilliniresistens TaxID=1298735 RepID=A0ABQ5VAR4_9PROT|nr:P-type conjugative transfer protein TrbL [Algimonas ampicilliniresistens]GLQ23849.1 conjugal transfer protein TrbL [Algimonas ampicilliniresistens]